MIGLGTYAFFWQHSDRVAAPLSLIGAFEATAALGVRLFQICDYAPLMSMGEAELRDAATAARRLGLTIELGTKGVDPDHLAHFLRLAEIFDARLERHAERMLRKALPAYESAGVTLALETYEQVATAHLVELVARLGSDSIGICLDPANVVARLEHPAVCVGVTAPWVKNVHAKDFAFARQDGWVGFTYSGAPMGEGLHDYAHLLDTVDPESRGINQIVEHWLPWQGDPETTIRTERDWTRTALEYLRSMS
jgi:sugar phosphate isomerase/epimerase